ncbi:uncharacterized protein K02A2.6-like [Lineus longissimus]|uniref:uncharacterized protein K02A2.6-like n=1 Tax=Lineus longissimus TaxID=88925 RepID=UPI00315D0444
MDRDAERECKTCPGCQLVAQPSYPEPMKRTEMPTMPWQDVGLDLLGPMPEGEYILAVVNYFSRYFEVDIVKSVTTTDMIRSLNEIFASHGYPLSFKSDNGPQFISEKFECYLEECGIEHRLSPALWPQANGEIERQNRTMFKYMRIAHAQGKDWKEELFNTLLSYRSTPHESTGVTPAKLMFNREIRTKLPELRDNTPRNLEARDRDAESKQKGKDYADQRRHAKDSDLNVGDRVLMQQAKKNKLTTRYGEKPLTVVEKTGSKVTVETDGGKQYRRNSAHLRRFEEQTTEDSTDNDIETEIAIDDDIAEDTEPVPQGSPQKIVTRFGREIKVPTKFKDFDMTYI